MAGEASVFYLSKAHQLFAVDRITGAETWRRSLGVGKGSTAGSAVVLSGRTVIAGDGDLFALDARTGALRWRTVDGEGADPGRFLGAVAGTTVFTGSATGKLVAFDSANGRERWRLHVIGVDVTVFAPVAEGDLVVAAFTDFGASPRSGGVVAADAASGQERWLARFPRVSTVRAASAGGPPSISGDLVAGGSTDGTVYVMDRSTGRLRWTIEPVSRAPAVRDDTTTDAPVGEHEDYRVVRLLRSLALVSSLSGVLTAVNIETRGIAWRFESPSDGSNGFGFTLDGRSAYVPFASGRVAIVDLDTGRARAFVGQPGLRFDWAPAVANNRMYLTAEDGLYVVDLD